MMELGNSFYVLIFVFFLLIAVIVFLGSFRMPVNYSEQARKREEVRKKVLLLNEKRKAEEEIETEKVPEQDT